MLRIAGGCLAIFAAIALGVVTFRRNLDYQSDLAIWEDTVAKAPGNYWAHFSLGNALVGRGRVEEAIAHYRKALEIKPDYAEDRGNLGAPRWPRAI